VDSVGSANLQSGFVLAAIIAAFLFADRLGGSDQLARRVYQVALGVTIAFLAISATAAFLRQPDVPKGLESSSFSESSSSSSSDSGSPSFSDGGGSSTSDGRQQEQKDFLHDVADRNAQATTIHAALGLIVLIAGLAALRRAPTVALGGALGGLLLLLFGGVHGASDNANPLTSFLGIYASLLGAASGGSSRWIDIAHFILLLGGAVALLAFGLLRWDREAESQQPAANSQ
jgi:hypothetical protein